MDYREAYEILLGQLLLELAGVDAEEPSRQFIDKAAREVRSQASVVPEFFVGEFMNLFKAATVRQCSAEVAACKQAIKDVNLDADKAMVELNVRLIAAQSANDSEAVHAVWREREERQAACQAGIDAVTRRATMAGLRLDTFTALASDLGVSFS